MTERKRESERKRGRQRRRKRPLNTVERKEFEGEPGPNIKYHPHLPPLGTPWGARNVGAVPVNVMPEKVTFTTGYSLREKEGMMNYANALGAWLINVCLRCSIKNGCAGVNVQICMFVLRI